MFILDVLSPYHSKYKLPFYIESIRNTSPSYEKLKAEYDTETKKLHNVEQKAGNELRQILLEYLHHDVLKRYPLVFKYPGEPDDMAYSLEMGNDLITRDEIEFLVTELDHEFDLGEIKKEITRLDMQLKEIFMGKLEKIVKCCPEFEEPCYPEKFWWHHLSKILAEKQAKQV